MFDRPALITIVDRVRNDILARLDADDSLRRADAEVYARVIAGSMHGLYGYLDWLSQQVIYDTAEADYLDRWATLYSVARKAASTATGSVTFAVTVGAVIPSGTTLQAADGTQFVTTADATIAAPSATAPVVSVVAGAIANRTAGETLTLISPVVGVQSIATAGTISGGADIETDDALRGRLLARLQTPPSAGTKADYIAWALQVAGVTRAWCYPNELGAGTVVVRFVRDNDVTIIPDAGEVATVQTYIDALRPVTAALTVVAPNAVPLNFTISGLSPSNATVQAAVQAELADLILREAEPGGTLLLSHIRAAISSASGENDYVLTSPAANVVNTTGNITTMGTITWL
ncbi:baseplate J/gp47 family protein [Ampullimonas aquatilis]|uniref:baseplate J/gp47 family protein n=1 Tax=Ampullimonas aquatilis TaxID=1341549 RepID=UPI003C73B376